MLKIKDRIAILYSVITIMLVILCSILFLFLFKYNMDKNSIIEDITNEVDRVSDEEIDSVTAPKGQEENEDSTDQIDSVTAPKGQEENEDITDRTVLVTTPKGQDNNQDIKIIKKNADNNEEDINKDDNEEDINKDDGGALNFTVNNFEERIIKNLYSRFFLILSIAITVIIIINFILSKRYALFALSPLNEFTRKVKHQQKLKSIGLIELPKAKDEIYDLTEAYNEVISKMNVSYKNLQRLNSYASHELRNSLAVLRTKIELEEESKDINNYIDKLNGTITDILAMSTNSLSKYQEDVDLALVCAKVVDEYSIIFKNIKFNMPLEGIELIKGREIWIERCIINLVDNAIKFMDKSKKNNEIYINIYQNTQKVIIEVYDNGIGIAEDKLEDIFIPYYGTNNRVSTGIGLAYIKHIMNLHNGNVLVESIEGEYTKFSLIFMKEIKENVQMNII